MENPNACSLISSLGSSIDITPELLKGTEAFVCQLYGGKSSIVNKLRYQLFCRKGVTNEALPPTADSLQHHAKRVNYHSLIWRNSLIPLFEPPPPSPIGNGWEYDNCVMVPKLTSQPYAPQAIFQFVACGCIAGKCLRNCKCARQSLPCTEVCACMAGTNCENPCKAQCEDLVSEDEED